MNPFHFHEYIVFPALEYLSQLAEKNLNTRDARRLLVAIAWQESRIKDRAQIVGGSGTAISYGPARGFWQFEKGGGLSGVIAHRSTQQLAVKLFKDMAIPFPQQFLAVELNDTIACCFARMLLYTDPRPLPGGNPAWAIEEQAWDYYVRNWRPGKPHRNTWSEAWRIGVVSTDE